MARRGKARKPGTVRISAETIATAAQQLGIARDRLIATAQVSGTKPDDSHSADFLAGWSSAMKVVQAALNGELKVNVTPGLVEEGVPPVEVAVEGE